MNKKINYQPYLTKFKQTKFPGEDWLYIAPTWEEMHQISLDLGVKILDEKKQFDVLVTLIKGGWTWSRTLADILQVSDLTSFRLRLYDPKYPGIKLEKPVLDKPLHHNLKNRRVLLFDDVDDSGESFKFALEYLKKFDPGSVTTATLFHKPHSKIMPHFYGAITKAWIIFPNERREAITGLANKWKKNNLDEKTIKNRLLLIGLPEKEIDLFLSL